MFLAPAWGARCSRPLAARLQRAVNALSAPRRRYAGEGSCSSGASTRWFPPAVKRSSSAMPNRVPVAAECRAPRGVANDRRAARLDRAVERLGDDPRADPVQLAAVALRLAQDVEPERRALDERRLAASSSNPSSAAPSLAVEDLPRRELVQRHAAVPLRNVRHLLPAGQLDHPARASGCGTRGSSSGLVGAARPARRSCPEAGAAGRVECARCVDPHREVGPDARRSRTAGGSPRSMSLGSRSLPPRSPLFAENLNSCPIVTRLAERFHL